MTEDKSIIIDRNLKKLKYVVLQWLDKEFMVSVDFSMHTSFLTDNLVMRVRGFVWAEEIDVVDIRYPRDWWQAFKERWFPRWLRTRYPVEYKEHHVDFMAKFPEYNYNPPSELGAYKLVVRHEEEWHDRRTV